MTGERNLSGEKSRRSDHGRGGWWGVFGPVALIMAAGLLLTAPAAQARKFSKRVAPGVWRTVDENSVPKKPLRAGEPLLINANGLTINVEFQDDFGVGFNDPAQGAERRIAVRNVLTHLAGVLNYRGRQLDVLMEASNTDGIGYLASGGTYFPDNTSPAGFYNGNAFKHLSSGLDPSPALSDLYCSINFGYPIHAGEGSPPGDQYDLASLLLHEFCHGLGIISLADEYGDSIQSESNPGIFSVWDSLLVAGVTYTNLWSGGGFFQGGPENLIGTTPGVYFSGSTATAVFGRYPRVMTLDTFEYDVSLSHFEQGIAGGSVMEPLLDKGETLRELTPLDKAALQDLGWEMWEPPANAADKAWTLYH